MWDGSDEIWSPWRTKIRVEELLRKIRNLERTDLGNDKKRRQELKSLKTDLEVIQKGCTHEWKVVQLFTHYRRYCTICDIEDRTYNYWDTMRKKSR
jgi:hypothetical protein